MSSVLAGVGVLVGTAICLYGLSRRHLGGLVWVAVGYITAILAVTLAV